MYLPSCPARGPSFTRKFMESVGLEIFWNGIAPGLSPLHREYHRCGMSEIPEIATIAIDGSTFNLNLVQTIKLIQLG